MKTLKSYISIAADEFNFLGCLNMSKYEWFTENAR